MKQEQTNQIIPRLFYKGNLADNIELEMSHFRTLTWANRCNGNGMFELVVPLNLADFIPELGGVFYTKYLFKGDTPSIPDTDYWDTPMFIERIVRTRTKTGQVLLTVTGSPRAISEKDLEDAQNNNAFYVWRYDMKNNRWQGTQNGVERPLRFDVNSGGQINSFDSDDIDESAIAEDNLGGHAGAVVLYTWGTTVIGQRKPMGKLSEERFVTAKAFVSPPESGYRYQYVYYNTPNVGETSYEDCVVSGAGSFFTIDRPFSYLTDIGLSGATFPAPIIVVGAASGDEGYMNTITYNENWIKRDEIETLSLYSDYFSVVERNPNTGAIRREISVRTQANISRRVIDVKSDIEYINEMRELLPEPASGTVYEDPDAVFVKGGHKDYTFTLKTWGNRRLEWSEPSPYPLFMNLGELVQINDALLQTEVIDVLSGVIETIDDNGYNIELELGTIFPRISTGF